MKIKELQMTCFACPSQWVAKTDDEAEQDVYIRYRWGELTMAIDNIIVIDLESDDRMDGVMSTEQMLQLLNLEVRHE